MIGGASRSGAPRRVGRAGWRGGLSTGLCAVLGLAAAGCGPIEDLLGGGDTTDPENALPEGLALSGCRSEPLLYDVSGVYAARFETVSAINGGNLDGAQTEIVTRYAAIQLCQRGTTVDATTVVCAMHHSPLYDTSQTCAAQVPTAALLRALPAVSSRGFVDASAPEVGFSLPWAERWGLDDTGTLPDEPSGAAQVASDTVVDTDGDELPGVTLRGDAEVPTLAWVARLTEASFDVTGGSGDGIVLSGSTRAATAEVVLGGPASRLLRGRSRGEGRGTLDLLRVDGVGGAPQLLSSGGLSCDAVVGLIGDVFADPRVQSCD